MRNNNEERKEKRELEMYKREGKRNKGEIIKRYRSRASMRV